MLTEGRENSVRFLYFVSGGGGASQRGAESGK